MSSKNPNLIPQTLEALKRLAETLKELDEKGSSKELIDGIVIEPLDVNTVEGLTDDTIDQGPVRILPIKNYRHIHEDVVKSYEMIQSAADLISASSTKFTLVERIKENDGFKLVEDLRRGAELIGTGALVMHSSNMGLGRSARLYVKHASRAVLSSLISLMESFDEGSARIKESTVGAQKTGAVWECCEKLKTIPRGNRNSMRRDLFQWLRDCNDTMEEFQEMIDSGPSSGSNNADWGDFCDGTEDQYTADELKIAQSCVAIVKCSRGTINGVMKICDYLGEYIDKEPSDSSNHELLWIATLHELARNIGRGVTDFGSLMYPPLDLDSGEDGEIALVCQLKLQVRALVTVNHLMSSLAVTNSKWSPPPDVTEFSGKLLAATLKRYQEVVDAIAQII